MLKDKTIMKIHMFFLNHNNDIYLKGKIFENYDSYFDYPLLSKQLYIYKAFNLGKQFVNVHINDM